MYGLYTIDGTYGLYTIEGTTVVDSRTGIRYDFQTYEFACMFKRLWDQYEQSKWDGVTLTGHGLQIGNAVTISFNINLGGERYVLDMSKPPTRFTRLILKLLNFKKL